MLSSLCAQTVTTTTVTITETTSGVWGTTRHSVVLGTKKTNGGARGGVVLAMLET